MKSLEPVENDSAKRLITPLKPKSGTISTTYGTTLVEEESMYSTPATEKAVGRGTTAVTPSSLQRSDTDSPGYQSTPSNKSRDDRPRVKIPSGRHHRYKKTHGKYHRAQKYEDRSGTNEHYLGKIKRQIYHRMYGSHENRAIKSFYANANRSPPRVKLILEDDLQRRMDTVYKYLGFALVFLLVCVTASGSATFGSQWLVSRDDSVNFTNYGPLNVWMILNNTAMRNVHGWPKDMFIMALVGFVSDLISLIFAFFIGIKAYCDECDLIHQSLTPYVLVVVLQLNSMCWKLVSIMSLALNKVAFSTSSARGEQYGQSFWLEIASVIFGGILVVLYFTALIYAQSIRKIVLNNLNKKLLDRDILKNKESECPLSKSQIYNRYSL